MKPSAAALVLLTPFAIWPIARWATEPGPDLPPSDPQVSAARGDSGGAHQRTSAAPQREAAWVDPIDLPVDALVDVGSDGNASTTIGWDELGDDEKRFLSHASTSRHIPFALERLPGLRFHRAQMEALTDQWQRFCSEKTAAYDLLDEEVERIKARHMQRGKVHRFGADHPIENVRPGFFGRAEDGTVRLPIEMWNPPAEIFRGWVEFRIDDEPSYAAAIDYLDSFDQYELALLQNSPRAIALH